MKNAFGSKLRELRRLKYFMTQDELARRMRSNQSQISRWESGADIPCPSDVRRLARILRWDSRDLLFRAEEAVVARWRKC